MALDAGCGEVELEIGALSRVGLQLEGLRHHVFCLEDWQRADRNLVKHVEFFDVWGHVRHNDFTAVGSIDQELSRHGLFVVIAIVVVSLVSVSYHKVLLQVNLNIFDFLFEKDQVGPSSNCQTTGLIGLVLVSWGRLLGRQGQDA